MNLLDKLQKTEYELHSIYKITLKFVTPIHGALPLDPDGITTYLELRKEPVEIIEEQITEMSETSLEEEIKKITTTFKKDIKGYYFGSYAFQACIKDVGSTLGYFVKYHGTKQVFQHGMNIWKDVTDKASGLSEAELLDLKYFRIGDAIKTYKLYFERDGEILTEPDGLATDGFTTSGPKGSRSIVKCSHYFENAELSFEIWLQPHAKINEEMLLNMLSRSQDNALGSGRQAGKGKFRIVALEKVKDGKAIK